MERLQIIATKTSNGLKLWAARAPEGIAAWWRGSGRHRVVGQALPADELFIRLALLQSPGMAGRMAQWAAQLRSREVPAEPMGCPAGLDVALGLSVLRDAVAGRIVFEERVLSLLRREGFWPRDSGLLLDCAAYHGLVEQLPGVSRQPWGAWLCNRCGGQAVTREPCPACRRSDCPLCTECIGLGASRGCRLLIAAPRAEAAEERAADFTLPYDLTPAQAEAAAQLEAFLTSDDQRTLVWAACGAGKTEVTFPLIRKALNAGLDVLFAVPRQDVVRELADRFRRAFTGVEVAVHYGGQPWHTQGPLVIATTHQVLHFYRRFGLAVLDEMDAFPYGGSEMLRFGLRRSLQPGGKLVEMSATPSQIPKSGRLVTIPVRHHGHPLPEPEFVKSRPGCIPQQIMEVLKDSEEQWLVFVPTVSACEELAAHLVEQLQEHVASCHSRHPQRREQIEAFRMRERRIMVATAVLERGVTFPGVHVIVVNADHHLFSRSALVQMAGRVGRSAAHPTGTVIFCGTRRNEAVKGAQAMIRRLNEEAERQGLLRGDLCV